jgi:hypothetical protein
MYPYPYLSPILGPDVPTDHRVHTDGVPHVFDFQVIQWPGGAHVIGIAYQVTTTLNITDIKGSIGLFQGTRAGVYAADVTGSVLTLVDATAAADTVYTTYFAPFAIAQGLSIGSMCKVASTDAGGVAGTVKIWWLLQPVGA